MRSIQEITSQPCRYTIKTFELAQPVAAPTPVPSTPSATPGMRKVLKSVQKVDENGNPVFKTVKVEVKKGGCGCKGGSAGGIVVEERQVPDTIDVWIEEPIPANEVQQSAQPAFVGQAVGQVLCKLYGTVPQSYCQKCKSYSK